MNNHEHEGRYSINNIGGERAEYCTLEETARVVGMTNMGVWMAQQRAVRKIWRRQVSGGFTPPPKRATRRT